MGRFSARWWAGHHMTRDACGSWTPDSNAGGECAREDGQQGSRRLRRKLRKEAAAADRARRQRQAETRRAAARSSGQRDGLREDVRGAQYAQELRAERVGADAGTRTRKGKLTDERRAFFGDKHAAATADRERRITAAGADREARARAAADREAAAAYRAAQRGSRPDKFSARAAARARAEAAADGW